MSTNVCKPLNTKIKGEKTISLYGGLLNPKTDKIPCYDICTFGEIKAVFAS